MVGQLSRVDVWCRQARVYSRHCIIATCGYWPEAEKETTRRSEGRSVELAALVPVGHTDVDAFGDVLTGSSEAAVPFEAATPSETTPVPGYSLGSDASVPTPVCPGLGWPPGGLAILWPVAGDEARTHGGLDKSFAVIL